MNPLSITIVGGGIGGLTAALALAQEGHQIRLFEQSTQFADIGAGIQLSPNCNRVLYQLGLSKQLAARAFLPTGIETRHWQNGKTINEIALGDACTQKYGFPYINIHRADLISILAEAVDRQENIEVHLSSRVLHLDQGSAQVNITISNTSAQQQHFNADLLIGADGIHSMVRQYLLGPVEPRFTGNIAWRMLVPSERIKTGLIQPKATAWWGPGAHFVHYYVSSGAILNCVCVVETPTWQFESWTEPGDPAELKASFDNWHPDIQMLLDLARPDTLFKWGLFDRTPLPYWGTQCITLLGDACHPTLPFMAQGAAMAIEDAAVLATVLAQGKGLEEKLEDYYRFRLTRTKAIQRGSQANARLFHLRGPAAWIRDQVARRTTGKNPLHWVFQHDVYRSTASAIQRD